MLQNVSDRLKDGGWFIGTIPNANWIVYARSRGRVFRGASRN
jgi:hypothetical protein